MIHDAQLLDRLSLLPIETFDGEVFRATRQGLDPTAPSTNGGRWAPPGDPAILYTSFKRDGALAEIAYHWALQNPVPTKPVRINRLAVRADRALRLIRSDFSGLGINTASFHEPNYGRTQEIGAAVAFMECDGLITPSARWMCDNLMLFTNNLADGADIVVTLVEEVDWQAWARSKGLL